jgi:uncharacterized RDD family membrane protein YckC
MNLNDPKSISVGTRLGAMILDHIIMTIVVMIFFVPEMIAGFADAFNVSHQQTDIGFMEGPFKYIGLFGVALYFCKDIINGRSIAKRILGLQVVDNKTGDVATPLQCFVRNLFCIIWIIEVIVALTNTSKRIGDRIAGTKLVYYDREINHPRISLVKLGLPVALSYGLMIFLMSFNSSLIPSKTNYNESSYNASDSKVLEDLITNSLGKYLQPDVRIYDTVANEKLKYVSVILQLKANYIDDDNNYEELHSMTTNVIYSSMPKETFTGKIKYVFQGSGQFQSRATNIGTYIAPRDK